MTLSVQLFLRCLPGLLAGAQIAAGVLVTVDDSTRYQTIEGWGTCMITWSLGSTPYNDIAWKNAYRDLGCNILRVAMTKSVLVDASGDMRIPVVFSDNLQSNVARMNFNLSNVSVFGTMARWLTLNALEPERVKIVGAVWSPPHWMKGPTGTQKNHVSYPFVTNYTPWLTGGSSGDSVGGRLLQDSTNLTQFGRYMAAWVRGFAQYFTVSVYAVSLQNELSFENPFDSCTYEKGPGTTNTPGASSQWWQYAGALKAVRDTFVAQGITTKIKGPHAARIGDSPANPFMLNQTMKYIQAVKQDSDTTLINFLSFYNCNGYLGGDSNAVKCWAGFWKGKLNVPGPWSSYLYAPGVQADGKRTWASETGGESAQWLNGTGGTPGSGAIVLAKKMHDALVHGCISTYDHWQMSDTSTTETEHTLLGRNNVANPLNSKKYCAYKHFSRYVRPGAMRIKATFENGLTSIGSDNEYDTAHALNVSAYMHTQDLAATIVLVNMRAANETVTINAPTNALNVLTYQVYQTSSNQNFARLADVAVADGQVLLSMPGYSVVTLYGQVPEPIIGGMAGVLLFAWRRIN